MHLTRFDSLQPHYNLVLGIEFEKELSLVCWEFGLAVIPYSPLAGGF
jgi:aryl-alcohol dehydrogenase-like predicted oxidoreductase